MWTSLETSVLMGAVFLLFPSAGSARSEIALSFSSFGETDISYGTIFVALEDYNWWVVYCPLPSDPYWAMSSVACRQLGYGPPVMTRLRYDRKMVEKTYSGELVILCKGKESSLTECYHHQRDTYCPGHYMNIDLQCLDVDWPKKNLQLVLVEEVPSSNNGTVLVSYNHRWGPICGNRSNSYIAKVVCKYFHFDNGTLSTPTVTTVYEDPVAFVSDCDGGLDLQSCLYPHYSRLPCSEGFLSVACFNGTGPPEEVYTISPRGVALLVLVFVICAVVATCCYFFVRSRLKTRRSFEVPADLPQPPSVATTTAITTSAGGAVVVVQQIHPVAQQAPFDELPLNAHPPTENAGNVTIVHQPPAKHQQRTHKTFVEPSTNRSTNVDQGAHVHNPPSEPVYTAPVTMPSNQDTHAMSHFPPPPPPPPVPPPLPPVKPATAPPSMPPTPSQSIQGSSANQRQQRANQKFVESSINVNQGVHVSSSTVPSYPDPPPYERCPPPPPPPPPLPTVKPVTAPPLMPEEPGHQLPSAPYPPPTPNLVYPPEWPSIPDAEYHYTVPPDPRIGPGHPSNTGAEGSSNTYLHPIGYTDNPPEYSEHPTAPPPPGIIPSLLVNEEPLLPYSPNVNHDYTLGYAIEPPPPPKEPPLPAKMKESPLPAKMKKPPRSPALERRLSAETTFLEDKVASSSNADVASAPDMGPDSQGYDTRTDHLPHEELLPPPLPPTEVKELPGPEVPLLVDHHSGLTAQPFSHEATDQRMR